MTWLKIYFCRCSTCLLVWNRYLRLVTISTQAILSVFRPGINFDCEIYNVDMFPVAVRLAHLRLINFFRFNPLSIYILRISERRYDYMGASVG